MLLAPFEQLILLYGRDGGWSVDFWGLVEEGKFLFCGLRVGPLPLIVGDLALFGGCGFSCGGDP